MLVNKPISKSEYMSRASVAFQEVLERILDDYSDNEEYYIDDFNNMLKTIDIEDYLI